MSGAGTGDVRVRGVVHAGPKQPYRRVSVSADGDGAKVPVTTELNVFQVTLDDGWRIAIELEQPVKVEVPPSSRRGVWRELCADGAAAGVAEDALAPFVTAEVVTEAINHGDTVEVFGRAIEQRFSETSGGPRTPARKQPAVIRARVITAGPTATVRMDALVRGLAPLSRDRETASALGAQWIGFVVALACTALVALRPWWLDLASALGWLGKHRDALARAALQRQENLAFVAALLPLCLLLAPRRPLPQFRSADRPLYSRKLDPLLIIAMLAGVTWPVLPFIASGPPHSRASLGILVSAAVSSWGILLAAWLSQRHVVRLLERLAQRPGEGPLAPGTRGVLVGTVADPSPAKLDGDDVAVGAEMDWDQGVGSSPDSLRSSRFVADGGFVLETARGAIAIDPRETAWATTHHTRTSRGSGDYTIRERILIGAPLVAEGTLSEGEVRGAGGVGLHLRAQGEEPVALLAGAAGVAPGQRAAEHLASRRRLLLGLAVCAAATAVAPLI